MNLKKIGKYSLYLIPCYGLYDQFVKKSKEERSPLGIAGSGIYTAIFIVKLALLPAYIGKGVTTKNWSPFNFNSKHKIEKTVEKKSKLEKTLYLKEFNN